METIVDIKMNLNDPEDKLVYKIFCNSKILGNRFLKLKSLIDKAIDTKKHSNYISDLDNSVEELNLYFKDKILPLLDIEE